MRSVFIEVLKLRQLGLWPKSFSILFILALYSLAVVPPPGRAQDRARHGAVVSCPPKEPGGQWIDTSLEFPTDSVEHVGGGRAIPFLINVNNGGRYFFYVTRSSATGSSFQVAMYDDVIRDFVQATPRRPNWNMVVGYTPSVIGYGGKVELKLPAYLAKASQAGVAQNLVLLMIHPDDQMSPSSYSVYYFADQCFTGNPPPPPPPAACHWEESTILGQPTGSWVCMCDGKPTTDFKRCGPIPK